MTDKEQSMVERCAKAIYEGRNGLVRTRALPWSRQPLVHRAPYLLDARAAIAAMREPTEAMCEIEKDDKGRDILWGPGVSAHPDDVDADPATVWRAMIDKALEQ